MFTTRRGLLAPQNTFLDTIQRRCDGTTSCFLLANARILDFPIIYTSTNFVQLMGFNRIEVLQKPGVCSYLHGPQTSKDIVTAWDASMKDQRAEQFEVILYRKNCWGKFARLVVSMVRQRSGSADDLNVDIAELQETTTGENNAAIVTDIKTTEHIKSSTSQAQSKTTDPLKDNGPVQLPGQQQQPPPPLQQQHEQGTSRQRKSRILLQHDLERGHMNSNDANGMNNDHPTYPGKKFKSKRNLLQKLLGPGNGVVNSCSSDGVSLNSSSRRLGTSRIIGMNTDSEDHVATHWLAPDLAPRYRPEPPCPPRHVLLHYSVFRLIWDWTILLLTGYTAVVVPLRIAVLPRPTWVSVTSSEEIVHTDRSDPWMLSSVPESLAIADAVIDVVFCMDIVLNFHTSFVGAGGEVVADPPIIRTNYLSGWFTLDLISCLPYEVIKYIWPTNSHGILGILDGLRIVRLLRIGRAARRIDQYLEYVSTLLLLMIVCFFLLAHWFACAWYAVGVLDLESKIQYGWIPRYFNDSLRPQEWNNFVPLYQLHSMTTLVNDTQVIRTDPQTMQKVSSNESTMVTWNGMVRIDRLVFLSNSKHHAPIEGHPNGEVPVGKVPLQNVVDKWSAYVTALYFSLSLLTTIGFGNVAAFTEAEKLLSIGCMLIGALVYATIFGNITTIVQQLYATRTRYNEVMKGVKDFLRIHAVPQELGERVIDYITSSWSVNKGIDTAKVLNYCPKDMQADISVHLNRCVFNSHPAFRLASDSCRRSLAVNFHTLHTAPGDLVFHQGESVEQLCFIASGSLEVLQDDEVIAILGKEDVFGDPYWRNNHSVPSAASVRALTYCTLHTIRLERLRAVLQFYHAFSNSFTRNLEVTHNLCTRVIFRKLTDVKREMELSMRRSQDPPLSTLPAGHPVRKLISRLRRPSQAGDLSSRQGLSTIVSGDSSLDASDLESMSGSMNVEPSKLRGQSGPNVTRASVCKSYTDADPASYGSCVSPAKQMSPMPDVKPGGVIGSDSFSTGPTPPVTNVARTVPEPVNPARKWARLISKAAQPRLQNLNEEPQEDKTNIQKSPITPVTVHASASKDTSTITTVPTATSQVTVPKPSEGDKSSTKEYDAQKTTTSTDPTSPSTSIVLDDNIIRLLNSTFQKALSLVHEDLKAQLSTIVHRIDGLEQQISQINQHTRQTDVSIGHPITTVPIPK